jgi:uncharacterized membrane protein
MESARDYDLDERFARMERMLAALEVRVDRLADSTRQHDSPRGVSPRGLVSFAEASAAVPAMPGDQTPYHPPQYRPQPKPHHPAATQKPHASMSESSPLTWITSKSAEWWLGRLGIAFVVLAMFFLFRYAVEHNWITPALRVAAGILTGSALFAFGLRTPRETRVAASKPVRLRELLLSGAIAIWYITGYAAAIVYQLIPVAGARVWFGAVSIAATWIALEEEQEIFALVAILAGFAAPFLLPTPTAPVIAFSIYLGAVTALGLVLYLMRGWQSLLWVAFAGLWMSLAPPTPRPVWTLAQALALTVLILAGGAAFTRVPTLRRRLVVLNPERYRTSGRSLLGQLRDVSATGGTATSEAPDSVALWVITIASPLISLAYLYTVWPDASYRAGGVAAFAMGAVAFMLGLRWHESDPEITRLEMTAGTFYTLIGLVMMTLNAATLPLVAVHAGLSRMLPRQQRFNPPRVIAKATLAAALGLVIVQATVAGMSNIQWSWIIGGIVTVGVGAGMTAMMLAEGERSGVRYAVLTFIALLLVAENALVTIWPPLLSVGYAILGGELLVSAPKAEPFRILGRFGVLTLLGALLVVIGQTLSVPMAAGEWSGIAAQLVTIVIAAITWRSVLQRQYQTEVEIALAVATYVALMLFLNRALLAFWPPLITVSYAFIGAGLLIAGSHSGARKILRQLGSLTMIIVALRLIFVDLASVETIWRVLLFLGCGGLFLVTAYWLQLKPKPAGVS